MSFMYKFPCLLTVPPTNVDWSGAWKMERDLAESVPTGESVAYSRLWRSQFSPLYVLFLFPLFRTLVLFSIVLLMGFVVVVVCMLFKIYIHHLYS